MSNCVLDASAVLAVLFQEPGEAFVRPWLRGGLISAVNAGEVLNKRYRPGESLERTVQLFRSLELRVVDFDFEQSVIAASFEPFARAANLSFADRACLSLGLIRELPVLTAEHDWIKPDLGIDIRLIRERKDAT